MDLPMKPNNSKLLRAPIGAVWRIAIAHERAHTLAPVHYNMRTDGESM